MTMSTETYADTLARLLLDTVGELPAISLPLREAIGRRLAADLLTKHPSPQFDNSQMDGYGIGYANVAGGRFRVGPDVPAGTDPTDIYHYGVNGYGHDTAVPIMTGAKIPEDVVAIIPVEQADPPHFVDTGEYVYLPSVEVGAFIRKTGSDMPAGTLLARENTLVDAALVAAAASQGIAELTVKARPKVAVVAGGDEVVAGRTPRQAQIFDANTPLMQGFGTTHGMEIVATGSTTDELRDFQSEIDRLIRDHGPDIIITSGGISEGKYEVVRQLLDRLEISWVGKIQQQPGGPQGYGVYNRTPIIALPGNPISTLVSLRMLVVPALWKAFRSGWSPIAVQTKINSTVTGIRGKTQYRRGTVGLQGADLVAQIQGEASSHLLAQAVGSNALLEIPPLSRFKPGQTVTAHLFADVTFDLAVKPLPHMKSHLVVDRSSTGDGQGKTAQVIIASTRAAAGTYEDEAGPQLVQWLRSKGYVTPNAVVVADQDLAHTMTQLMAKDQESLPDLLITSGGTGISPTDQTVDVISEILDVQLPHVMTAILLEGLQHTPHAALSRGVAGIVGHTFVVTLPGSLGGVRDGMTVLDDIVDHIVEQIRGQDHQR